jgi:hypothetical protein
MKYLKVYEDFDLDKFLEDPEGNIHDDRDPEIGPGDWVTSYRGIGQVLEMPRSSSGLLKVQLVNSAKSIVQVPLELATKIRKEEAEIASSRIPQTTKELEGISNDLDLYSESVGAYEDNPSINDPESATEFLEEVLIKLIELKQKDPYTIYHKEYSSILMTFGNLVDVIISSTEDQGLIRKIKKIDDDFYQLSE